MNGPGPDRARPVHHFSPRERVGPLTRLRPVDQPELARSVNWLDSAGLPAYKGRLSSQSPRGSQTVYAVGPPPSSRARYGAADRPERQLRPREEDPECRAAAGAFFDPGPPAVQLREPGHERQADAQTRSDLIRIRAF